MQGKGILAIAALALAVGAPALPAATHDVTVISPASFRFTPNDITIAPGDTVRWTIDTPSIEHDVTADDASWKSTTSEKFVYERTFNTVGEVFYHCSLHSTAGRPISRNMNGRINVAVPSANQAPTADFQFSCSDLDCSFTDTSTDSDGSIASRAWNFGDGGSSTAANPTHHFAAAGAYNVMLTVKDNDGDSATRSRSVSVSAPPAGFLINSGISDAWYAPATAGQGFFIIVWPQSGLMFLSWFTYDSERPPADVSAMIGDPGHRWLTAQGPFAGDTADLDVYLSQGGTFDSAEPPVAAPTLVGSISITWTGCNAADLTYDLPALGLSGIIPIERIVLDRVPRCEAAQ